MADFEAGLGTLSRMRPGQIDRFLLVVEPTAKALEVGRRALGMIRDAGLGHVLVIANRLASESDARSVRNILAPEDSTTVPDDPELRAADASGRAPFDACREAPAVAAIRAVAAGLLQ